jgi:hypothetical protein
MNERSERIIIAAPRAHGCTITPASIGEVETRMVQK